MSVGSTTTRKGGIPACVICNKEVGEPSFFVVSEYIHSPKEFKCPCGKTFTVEYKPELGNYIINKECTCSITFNDYALEEIRHCKAWERKDYVLCKECFAKDPMTAVALSKILPQKEES